MSTGYYPHGDEEWRTYLRTSALNENLERGLDRIISRQTREVIASSKSLERRGVEVKVNEVDYRESFEGLNDRVERLNYVTETLVAVNEEGNRLLGLIGNTLVNGLLSMDAQLKVVSEKLETVIECLETPLQVSAYERFRIANRNCKVRLYSKALKRVNEAIEQYDEAPEFHFLKGVLLLGFVDLAKNKEVFKVIDPVKAEKCFLEAYENSKTTNKVIAENSLYYASFANFVSGDFLKALDQINKAIGYSGLDDYYYHRAKLLTLLGGHSEARKDLRRLFYIDPRFLLEAGSDSVFRAHSIELDEHLQSIGREYASKVNKKIQESLIGKNVNALGDHYILNFVNSLLSYTDGSPSLFEICEMDKDWEKMLVLLDRDILVAEEKIEREAQRLLKEREKEANLVMEKEREEEIRKKIDEDRRKRVENRKKRRGDAEIIRNGRYYPGYYYTGNDRRTSCKQNKRKSNPDKATRNDFWEVPIAIAFRLLFLIPLLLGLYLFPFYYEADDAVLNIVYAGFQGIGFLIISGVMFYFWSSEELSIPVILKAFMYFFLGLIFTVEMFAHKFDFYSMIELITSILFYSLAYEKLDDYRRKTDMSWQALQEISLRLLFLIPLLLGICLFAFYYEAENSVLQLLYNGFEGVGILIIAGLMFYFLSLNESTIPELVIVGMSLFVSVISLVEVFTSSLYWYLVIVLFVFTMSLSLAWENIDIYRRKRKLKK